jgi:hypothetical protein
MKPIETKYNGYKFRSRLEARWAIFFDFVGIKYQYEIEAFEIGNINYLPDFFLPEENYFVEIKPNDPPTEELEKVQSFAWHKPILLLIGEPYATFDKHGAGVRLEYVGRSYIDRPVLCPGNNELEGHPNWGSPLIFIQCRGCENFGLESRGIHFNEFLEKDLESFGAYQGFCCNENCGDASSPKLIKAYTEAREFRFW